MLFFFFVDLQMGVEEGCIYIWYIIDFFFLNFWKIFPFYWKNCDFLLDKNTASPCIHIYTHTFSIDMRIINSCVKAKQAHGLTGNGNCSIHIENTHIHTYTHTHTQKCTNNVDVASASVSPRCGLQFK